MRDRQNIWMKKKQDKMVKCMGCHIRDLPIFSVVKTGTVFYFKMNSLLKNHPTLKSKYSTLINLIFIKGVIVPFLPMLMTLWTHRVSLVSIRKMSFWWDTHAWMHFGILKILCSYLLIINGKFEVPFGHVAKTTIWILKTTKDFCAAYPP